MRRAAELWSQARNTGQPTAPAPALDGDVILAAQAATFGSGTLIATENARHVGRYTAAAHCQLMETPGTLELNWPLQLTGLMPPGSPPDWPKSDWAASQDAWNPPPAFPVER